MARPSVLGFCFGSLFLAGCGGQGQSNSAVELGDVIIAWNPSLAGKEVLRSETWPAHASSYTFFLAPSGKAFRNATPEESYTLYRQGFQTFSQVNGDENLAIWFRDKSNPSQTDAVLSAQFAGILGLDPNRGPFLVYVRLARAQTMSLTKQSGGGQTVVLGSADQLRQAVNSKAIEKLVVDLGDCNLKESEDIMISLAVTIDAAGAPKNAPIPNAQTNCKWSMWYEKAAGLASAFGSAVAAKCGFEAGTKSGISIFCNKQ